MASKQFIEEFNSLAHDINKNAQDKGFWFENWNHGEKIALCHSELSEALESIRKDYDGPDKHCPEFSNVVIELADCVIRIIDYCTQNKLPLAEAIIAKHNFNTSRPYLHGKKF